MRMRASRSSLTAGSPSEQTDGFTSNVGARISIGRNAVCPQRQVFPTILGTMPAQTRWKTRFGSGVARSGRSDVRKYFRLERLERRTSEESCHVNEKCPGVDAPRSDRPGDSGIDTRSPIGFTSHRCCNARWRRPDRSLQEASRRSRRPGLARRLDGRRVVGSLRLRVIATSSWNDG